MHTIHTTHANTVHMSHQGLSGTSVGPHTSFLSQSHDSTTVGPSPQMNHLIWWLFQRRAHVQLIALHIPGKRNWGADGLSRDGVEGASIADVLDSAAAAGMVLRRLALPGGRGTVFAEAAALPQSARAGNRKRRRGRR